MQWTLVRMFLCTVEINLQYKLRNYVTSDEFVGSQI